MISDAVLLALITAVPSTLAALGALIVGLRNSDKIKDVARQTDGMATEMAKLASDEGYSRGKVQGTLVEQARASVVAEEIAVGIATAHAAPPAKPPAVR